MSCHIAYGGNHLGEAESCAVCVEIGRLCDEIHAARNRIDAVSAAAQAAFDARFRELEHDAATRKAAS